MSIKDLMKKQKEKAVSGETYRAKPTVTRDERFYTISKDQKGDGKVTIRFVPSYNKDKTDLVQYVTQQFHNVNWNKDPLNKKSEKRYWAGVCPRTHDPKAECPVCQYGFDKGGEIEKLSGEENQSKPDQILRRKYFHEFVSKDKRITNILVVKDSVNPDNQGKIFLFELKNSIFKLMAEEAEKIQNQLEDLSPEERQAAGLPADLEGFDAYDLMCSKDLTLVYKDKKNHPDKDPKHYWGGSYWSPAFSDKVGGDWDKLDALVSEAYCLDEFTAKENMPTTEFLEEKLAHITFQNSSTPKKKASDSSNTNDVSNKSAEPTYEKTETKTVDADTALDDIINSSKGGTPNTTNTSTTPKADIDIDSLLGDTNPAPKEEPKSKPKKDTSPGDIDIDALLNG